MAMDRVVDRTTLLIGIFPNLSLWASNRETWEKEKEYTWEQYTWEEYTCEEYTDLINLSFPCKEILRASAPIASRFDNLLNLVFQHFSIGDPSPKLMFPKRWIEANQYPAVVSPVMGELRIPWFIHTANSRVHFGCYWSGLIPCSPTNRNGLNMGRRWVGISIFESTVQLIAWSMCIMKQGRVSVFVLASMVSVHSII